MLLPQRLWPTSTCALAAPIGRLVPWPSVPPFRAPYRWRMAARAPRPLPPRGRGLSSLAAVDILYASAANTLTRRAAGLNGQVIGVTNGVPVWANANAHNHFAQNWTGASDNGFLVPNDSTAVAASALIGL